LIADCEINGRDESRIDWIGAILAVGHDRAPGGDTMQRAQDRTRRVADRFRKVAYRPALEFMEDRVLLAIIEVTTTASSGPGSLYAALTLADPPPNSPPSAYSGPDIIDFALPADSSLVNYNSTYQQWTIDVPSTLPLPAITGQVTIDGYSQNVITNVPAANAEQSISLSGLPTGGTFTLTFEGETTAPIPYKATATQVGAALMALPNIGQGNIVATLGPLNTTFVLVTFTNALAGTAVGQITGNASGLIPTPPLTSEVVTAVLSQGSTGNITSNVNTLTVGSNAHVRVIVEGGSGGTQASFPGLTIQSDHNTVRGLSIDGFSTGISISGSAAVGNLIQGNFIGQYVSYVNPLITALSGGPISTVRGIGNGVGVDIAGATNSEVGGVAPDAHDAISGNLQQGVRIEVGADGNQVTGDLIGVLQQDSTVYYQVGNGAEGVLVMSSSNVIGGAVAGSTNIISANLTYGIHIEGTAALRNLVEANYIGTDINGTYLFGQGDPGNGQNNPPQTGNLRDGIFIDDSPDNQIGAVGATNGVGNVGANVIALNFGAGIRISGISATGNVILGNIIGTGVDGARPLGNAQEGVRIESAGNTVGGTITGSGNLISANLSGVSIVGAGATDNLVAGNAIGTDGTGAYDLGNATEGVLIDSAAGNTIGGTAAAARNVIAGNNIGVLIENTSTTLTATANLLLGNYIGTDITGALALGNSQEGVEIDAVPGNTIGGSSSGAGNVISANHWGLVITGSSATSELVQGNFIGTDATGKLPLGNEVDGVLVENGAANNTIGGHGAGVGNTIGFNVQDGVQIASNGSISNGILSNSIFSNGGLGIDLVPSGTAQPPNLLLPSPMLSSVESTASGVDVSGTYTGAANATYLIQFFASTSAEPSGIAEGEQFLGTFPVTIVPSDSIPTPSGSFTESFTEAIAMFVPAGQLVTATATDAANNTSMFSQSTVEQPTIVQYSMTTFNTSQASGIAVITVTRTGGLGFGTVDFVVSNGTGKFGLFAGPGVDYGQPPGTTTTLLPPNQLTIGFVGTLVFNAGQTTPDTFTIPLFNNGLPGVTKTVNLGLQNATGAAMIGSPASATLFIANSNLPAAFQFSMANYQVNAAAGSVTITVQNASPGAAASVMYSTGGGTAVPGVEYTPVSGTLFFAQGQMDQTFTIPIIDNQSVKVEQTVGLQLNPNTVVNGNVSPTLGTAIVTIEPDLLDRTGPTVLSIRFITVHSGIITKLVVAFDKPLNPTTAVNLVNYGYSVRTAGRSHIFGSPDNLIIPIIAAVYHPSNRTVTLKLGRGIHPSTPFMFTINESTSVPSAGIGVSSLTGNLLDGNYSGVAGTPFSAILIGKTRGFNAPAGAASAIEAVVASGQSPKKKRVVVVTRGAHATAVPAPARVFDSDRRFRSHPKGPRG
jgi:Calx-beta domain